MSNAKSLELAKMLTTAAKQIMANDEYPTDEHDNDYDGSLPLPPVDPRDIVAMIKMFKSHGFKPIPFRAPHAPHETCLGVELNIPLALLRFGMMYGVGVAGRKFAADWELPVVEAKGRGFVVYWPRAAFPQK